MTGDMGDLFNDLKDLRRLARAKHGQPCPICTVKLPKAQPTILLPQQRCRVCGFRDRREEEYE